MKMRVTAPRSLKKIEEPVTSNIWYEKKNRKLTQYKVVELMKRIEP